MSSLHINSPQLHVCHTHIQYIFLELCYLAYSFAVAEQGGIASQGQIYMGAPNGLVDIHLWAKLLPM